MITPSNQDKSHEKTKKILLWEVTLLFLKLGFTAFGGPAAHIAMMRDEVVRIRKWVSEQQFLDILGASNLIPGPTSTEMAIYLGFIRAGWPGLILGGVCFIVPAMVIVLAIAWSYVQYGNTPQAVSLLYGINPVIIAIIVNAIWGLGKTAIRGIFLGLLGATALILYLLGINPIILLFGIGVLYMLTKNVRRYQKGRKAYGLMIPFFLSPISSAIFTMTAAGAGVAVLFLTFLKIGSILYGSGYVLLAFLRDDFVVRLGWLTDKQIIDAVAVGQFTPGPVFTTATFIGYIIAGIPGALLSTLAIFLPSFIFTAIVYSILPRLRNSVWMNSFLDGVNVAALGLMAAVTAQLVRSALIDIPTVLIAAASLVALIRFKINSAWLVFCGGMIGFMSAC